MAGVDSGEILSASSRHVGMRNFDPPLDPGIEAYVRALVDEGVETSESCEGGPGHAYPEPTIEMPIRFREAAISVIIGAKYGSHLGNAGIEGFNG
jgi:hypothetical protein